MQSVNDAALVRVAMRDRYYTFNPRPDVCFFMLETTYPTPEQFEWLEKKVDASTSKRISTPWPPLGQTVDLGVLMRRTIAN